MLLIIQRTWNGLQSRRSYVKFSGNYNGYSYGRDVKSDDYNSHELNGSTACITYKSLNRLEILCTQNKETWEGTIYMKNKNVGDLTWKYKKQPLRIGSKEISFWEDGAEKIVYINERFDEKYGRELFIWKDSKNGK